MENPNNNHKNMLNSGPVSIKVSGIKCKNAPPIKNPEENAVRIRTIL
ncbi:MAG: hypothetical protein H3Z50_04095 [archaeon]|nr:hypothetical protein [archaeon]